MSDPIYLSPPHLGNLERELLLNTFDSNWVASVGPHLEALENDLAGATGTNCAVAVSSGTAGLHLALLAAGIGPGDVVLVPSLTFAATANSVMYVGATPVFVDSTAETWTIDPTLVATEIASRADGEAPVRAILPVDIFGQCADYDPLLEACRHHGVVLIEDAAEALGSSYRDRQAGGFGRAGVISFNGNKILTAGAGGALVTDDAEFAEYVRYLATQARDQVPYYHHREIGHNYRMNNLLASIARAQLLRLEDRVSARRSIFNRYQEAFASVPGIKMMPQAVYGISNCWLSCVLVDPSTFGATSEDVRVHLASQAIEARSAWKPLHLQPVFAGAQVIGGTIAEQIYHQGLCLPSGSALTPAQQSRVIDAVLSVPALRRTKPASA